MTSENSFPRSTCSSSSVVSSQLGSQSEEPILVEKTPASTSPRSWLDRVHAQVSTSEVHRSRANTLLPTSPGGGNGCSRNPWSECTHSTNTEEQRTCVRAAIVCYHQASDGLYVAVTKEQNKQASTKYYLPAYFTHSDGKYVQMRTVINKFKQDTGIQIFDYAGITSLLARPEDVARGSQALLRGELCDHDERLPNDSETTITRTIYYAAVKLDPPPKLMEHEQCRWMHITKAARTLEYKSDLCALVNVMDFQNKVTTMRAKAVILSAFHNLTDLHTVPTLVW